MKIHHLNCGTMCPFGVGEGFKLTGRFVCHCLLIETEAGLVLVDTGLGRGDIERGMGRLFEWSCRPALDVKECAISQVQALGFDPADVRHIVATHLDLDHAGGLPDFPNATVHVHSRELEATRTPDRNAKMRYVPRHWAHDVAWQTYREVGEPWMGFEAIRELDGLEGLPLFLVPLPGHSRGHAGVAVQRDDDQWLFHCGDAYFHRNQITPGAKAPLGIRVFQNTMVTDRSARDHNIARIAELVQSDKAVTVFCAHDATSFDALTG